MGENITGRNTEIRFKYEILINEPDGGKIKILITKEQLDVIEYFADVEVDSYLNKTYILNKCRFRIVPHIEIKTEA